MDEATLLKRLRRRCDEETQAVVAAQIGISQQYLSDILAGRRKIGPTVLDALGVERRVTYQPTNGS